MSSKNDKKKSFILSLKKEGRITEDTLNVISDLTLEELIAVKLESSARATSGKLYNFPIWYTIPNICRDACIKFARSCCNTKTDMSNLLGIPYDQFNILYRKYYSDY